MAGNGRNAALESSAGTTPGVAPALAPWHREEKEEKGSGSGEESSSHVLPGKAGRELRLQVYPLWEKEKKSLTCWKEKEKILRTLLLLVL